MLLLPFISIKRLEQSIGPAERWGLSLLISTTGDGGGALTLPVALEKTLICQGVLEQKYSKGNLIRHTEMINQLTKHAKRALLDILMELLHLL